MIKNQFDTCLTSEATLNYAPFSAANKLKRLNKLIRDGYEQSNLKDREYAIFAEIISHMIDKPVAWCSDDIIIANTKMSRSTYYTYKKSMLSKGYLKMFDRPIPGGLGRYYVLTDELDKRLEAAEERKHNGYIDKKIKACGTQLDDIFCTDEYYIEDVHEIVAQKEDIQKSIRNCAKNEEHVQTSDLNINTNILDKNNNYNYRFSDVEQKRGRSKTENVQTPLNADRINTNQPTVAEGCNRLINNHIDYDKIDSCTNDIQRPVIKATGQFHLSTNLSRSINFDRRKNAESGEVQQKFCDVHSTKLEEPLPDNFSLDEISVTHAKQFGLSDEQIIFALSFFTAYFKNVKSRNWQKAFQSWIIKCSWLKQSDPNKKLNNVTRRTFTKLNDMPAPHKDHEKSNQVKAYDNGEMKVTPGVQEHHMIAIMRACGGRRSRYE